MGIQRRLQRAWCMPCLRTADHPGIDEAPDSLPANRSRKVGESGSRNRIGDLLGDQCHVAVICPTHGERERDCQRRPGYRDHPDRPFDHRLPISRLELLLASCFTSATCRGHPLSVQSGPFSTWTNRKQQVVEVGEDAISVGVNEEAPRFAHDRRLAPDHAKRLTIAAESGRPVRSARIGDPRYPLAAIRMLFEQVDAARLRLNEPRRHCRAYSRESLQRCLQVSSRSISF